MAEMTCREKILSNQYVDVMTDFYVQSTFQPGELDLCYQEIDTSLGIFYINQDQLPRLEVMEYGYLYIPKCYGIMQEEVSMGSNRQPAFDSTNLIDSGILAVQRPPLSLTGKGVAIGFIDTGIRYQEDVFKKADGTTRIIGLWDQTIQAGDPPQGLQYGTEYRRVAINAALKAENPLEVVPSTDTIGHGTELASIAAGSSIDEGFTFTGAAPDADIIVVKLKEAKQNLKDYYQIPDGVPCYAGSDIWSALKYIESFAQNYLKPVVICFGLGTNTGDHAGNAEVSKYMSLISSRRNRAIVVCGGNEGNAAHHYEGRIESNASDNWDDVEILVGEGEKGFITELWGAVPSLFTISIRTPGGEQIPYIYYRGQEAQRFSFVYEKTVVTVSFALVENTTGDELITIRFVNPTPGVWTIRVYGESNYGEANFHLWLPIQNFLSANTYFLKPNPYTTLTVPGYTENIITTSTYNGKNNSFYLNSGRGFSRLNRIKPDFAAPGVDISTVLGPRTGSSMAAAITAGAVAQFLQWAVVEKNDVRVDSNNIKNYFIRGATREGDIVYPSREWGYGRLDIAGTFRWLAGG